MLQTWKKTPTNIRLLRKALLNARPVLNQVRKSGYIFVFNLPVRLANLPGTLANYMFLRICHAIAAGRKHPLESTQAAEALASSLGPGVAQIEEAKKRSKSDTNALSYPESVAARAHDGGWSHKIRLYRDGLATGKWEKSIDTLVALQSLSQQNERQRRRSSSNAGLFDNGLKDVFQAPVTIIWGARDVAISRPICIDGVGDYFARGSQMVVVERAGHWCPQEKGGREVFEEVVAWAVGGERGWKGLKGVLGEKFPDEGVKVVVER